MKSYAFLFWAYNVVWIGIAGYVLWMILRLGRLDARLRGVEQELSRKEASG